MNTQENSNENTSTRIQVATTIADTQKVNLTVTAGSKPEPCNCDAPAAEAKQEEPAAPVEETAAPAAEPVVEEVPAEQPAEEEAPANPENKPAGKGKNRPKRERKPVCEVTQESLDEVKDTLLTIFRFLDLQGELAIENRGQSVSIMISSDEAGKIIGHHGNNLDSLQVILNRVIQKKYNDYPKIYIDIASEDRPARGHKGEHEGGAPKFGKAPREGREGREGRRGRDRGPRDDSRGGKRFSGRREFDEEGGNPRVGRDEKLRMQAIDAAKEVRLFGEPKTLPPMNPHDRRIIHLTLENEVGIVTESIGDGDCRSVVISPKD